jgi:hypothetical protein
VNAKKQSHEESTRCEDVSMLLLWMPNFTMDGAIAGRTEQLEDKSPAGRNQLEKTKI